MQYHYKCFDLTEKLVHSGFVEHLIFIKIGQDESTQVLKRRFVICILHKFPVRILKSESDRKKEIFGK